MQGALLLAALTGCLVDTNNPCDANETVLKADFGGCVCSVGSVPNETKDGCVPCGANEVVASGACACSAGFARLTAGGVCTLSQLGASCSDASGCAGDYPYCSPGASDRYCTRSCTASTDCPAGYACESALAPAYCSRPPRGQGDVCDVAQNSADCTSEADYCAQGHCLVSGCASTTTCHGDWVCCDFRSVGAKDICIAPSGLVDGHCPATGAAPVTR
jgi:hypothetical protein